MSIEEPTLITQYGIYLQPFVMMSILLGIYGLTVAVKSLQEIAAGKHCVCFVETKGAFSSITCYTICSPLGEITWNSDVL